jgi:hypothetical protein
MRTHTAPWSCLVRVLLATSSLLWCNNYNSLLIIIMMNIIIMSSKGVCKRLNCHFISVNHVWFTLTQRKYLYIYIHATYLLYYLSKERCKRSAGLAVYLFIGIIIFYNITLIPVHDHYWLHLTEKAFWLPMLYYLLLPLPIYLLPIYLTTLLLIYLLSYGYIAYKPWAEPTYLHY